MQRHRESRKACRERLAHRQSSLARWIRATMPVDNPFMQTWYTTVSYNMSERVKSGRESDDGLTDFCVGTDVFGVIEDVSGRFRLGTAYRTLRCNLYGIAQRFAAKARRADRAQVWHGGANDAGVFSHFNIGSRRLINRHNLCSRLHISHSLINAIREDLSCKRWRECPVDSWISRKFILGRSMPEHKNVSSSYLFKLSSLPNTASGQ